MRHRARSGAARGKRVAALGTCTGNSRTLSEDVALCGVVSDACRYTALPAPVLRSLMSIRNDRLRAGMIGCVQRVGLGDMTHCC